MEKTVSCLCSSIRQYFFDNLHVCYVLNERPMKREISLTTETANDKKKSRRLVDKISRNEYSYVFPDLEMKYL